MEVGKEEENQEIVQAERTERSLTGEITREAAAAAETADSSSSNHLLLGNQQQQLPKQP